MSCSRRWLEQLPAPVMGLPPPSPLERPRLEMRAWPALHWATALESAWRLPKRRVVLLLQQQRGWGGGVPVAAGVVRKTVPVEPAHGPEMSL